ncbi:MAG TPA: zf-HC2 domain-containing protein [Thermoanaerobaculia bacterium]
MTAVDHAYAEEHGLVDAYLAERLSESERDAFEAHFFACETCLAQLEMANDFREGMRDVAAEETARASLGVLAAVSWKRRIAWAAVLLLLVALPLGLLLARNRSLERQLVEARTVSPTVEDPRVARLEAELKAARESGAGDRKRLEDELAKARQARSEEKTAENRPQVNVPVFLLAAVRSGDEADREPVNRIPLPAAGQPVLLTMELATVDFPAFRASLRDGKGQEIWRSSGLAADERDTLTILLPSSMLSPGVYELTIQGEGQGAVIGAYPFRVTRRP